MAADEPPRDAAPRVQDPMFLGDVEDAGARGPEGATIAMLRAAGLPVPQIMYLFAFKPEATKHLARYSQAVMRGPSPLPPGFRELIAAYTSALNHCPF